MACPINSFRFTVNFVYQIDVRVPSQKKSKTDVKLALENSELLDSMKILGKIHKGIVNLQLQQQRDRHRLTLHSATNLLNYDHVYYGSLIETAIFIFVSIFQVSLLNC